MSSLAPQQPDKLKKGEVGLQLYVKRTLGFGRCRDMWSTGELEVF